MISINQNFTIVCCAYILTYTQVGWCFDDDISINEPNFKPETFLDYKAYEFRKSVQEEWYASENGWRMAGGSLSADVAYVDGEVRLEKNLSDTFSVRLLYEYLAYYDIKPVEAPMIEFALRPWNHSWAQAIELSFLGTPTFDKRSADLGFAATVGKRKGNYLRLTSLSVDHYYNDKNLYDDSYYEQQPHTLELQGAYRYDRWQLRFAAENDRQFTFVMPDTSSEFQYDNYLYQSSLDYHYAHKALIGVAYRKSTTEKALSETVDNQQQRLSHFSIDLYWLQPIRHNDELTIGTRFDRFDNKLLDINDANNSYDYRFDTWQVYAMIHHDYSPHAGWGLGVYIGDTGETKDYLSIDTDNKARKEWEGELRTSWEYRSLDNKDRLMFSFTFNLDDLIDDPGDGVGISYQGLF